MTIDTTYLDSDTDSIKAARPAILAMAQELNNIGYPAGSFPGFMSMQDGQAWGVTFGNPASGTTVVLVKADRIYLNIAVATKAAVTFWLPTPIGNGTMIRICTDAAITALTVADGAGVAANVVNAPTTLAVGGFCEFVYRLNVTKWYRVG